MIRDLAVSEDDIDSISFNGTTLSVDGILSTAGNYNAVVSFNKTYDGKAYVSGNNAFTLTVSADPAEYGENVTKYIV